MKFWTFFGKPTTQQRLTAKEMMLEPNIDLQSTTSVILKSPRQKKLWKKQENLKKPTPASIPRSVHPATLLPTAIPFARNLREVTPRPGAHPSRYRHLRLLQLELSEAPRARIFPV